jgi:hypothetical protein
MEQNYSWGPQLVKELPACYGNYRFTITFTRAHSTNQHLPLSCTRSVQSLYPQPTSRSILILSSHTCVSFILWILEIFQDSYLLYLHKRFQDLFLANIYILVNKVFTVWDDDILTWCNHTITDISPFPLARTWTKSCHIPTDGDSTEIGWAMWIITTHHQA